MSSASAIDASLPDWMMTPWRSSSTVTVLRGSMNMREPSVFHARCDTSTVCDAAMVFARRAAKTQYAVMSFVSEAGSRRSSAFTPASVWLLSVSTSTHAAAATPGAPFGPAGSASAAGVGAACCACDFCAGFFA